MKTTSKLIILIPTFLALAASAYAQTPREQFQSAVAAFQKNATEDNARKLAEVHKQLDPPPAVPEEAEFRALKGVAFVTQGNDAAAFVKAAVEFQAAIAAAPWAGEYHYNLAVCEKSAGRLSAAQTALKFAQIFARDEKERRDGLALRAELEAAQELSAAAKAAADTPQARETALLKKVEGARFVDRHTPENSGLKPGTMAWDVIFDIRDRTMAIATKIYYINAGSVFGHRQPGEYSVDRISYRDGAFTHTFNGFTTVYRIRQDGGALLSQSCSGCAILEIPRN